VTALVYVVLGFALGSIPFGVLVAKRLGIDIQQHGSGNIGATNVTRVLGIIPGAVVLVLDVAKGALAVWLAARGCGDWVVAAVGFAAISGHCFSPWLGGRGGKGVATALGVFLVLHPPLAAIAVLVFGVVVAVSRIPALGSLAAVMTIAVILVYRADRPFATLAIATAALMLYTHRTNLAKLKLGVK
jgi:glycerol-3-phosphate acyltransferase PlsY